MKKQGRRLPIIDLSQNVIDGANVRKDVLAQNS